MPPVQHCPKNETEVNEASKRLECGSDIYGNNQYMCLPNRNKTALFEFCHEGIMGIQKPGICLEIEFTKEGWTIHEESCLDFRYGCPKKEFWNHHFFYYPACQNIDSMHRCYLFHPECQSRSFIANETTVNGNTGPYNAIFVPVVVVFVIVLIAVAIVLFWKKIQKTLLSQAKDVDKDMHKCVEAEPFSQPEETVENGKHNAVVERGASATLTKVDSNVSGNSSYRSCESFMRGSPIP
uniref:Uncharacterized protein LOC111101370 isoform X2 n=1 Tax=Crassostrea virginica TaxID=6565 RepID=A0A8B8ADK0_CRAVI|nr:uncharacterized protein LOC111101370 isoform X2 [Crassostrea virginica]XP_022289542.1 uncharacterized protein LOC111101370 isoform X2 [Crassostrea virginica]XP_022289543.1 uncharacterized protein LOC111101370 isoform X2 [Crassostrea virginica]